MVLLLIKKKVVFWEKESETRLWGKIRVFLGTFVTPLYLPQKDGPIKKFPAGQGPRKNLNLFSFLHLAN